MSIQCGHQHTIGCPKLELRVTTPPPTTKPSIDLFYIVLNGVSKPEFDTFMPRTGKLFGHPSENSAATSFALHFATSHRSHENRRVMASGVPLERVESDTKWLWRDFADAGYAALLSEASCPITAERALVCTNRLNQREPCTLTGAAAAETRAGGVAVASMAHCHAPFHHSGVNVAPCLQGGGHAYSCSLRWLRHFAAENKNRAQFAFVTLDVGGDERRGDLDAFDRDLSALLRHLTTGARPSAVLLASDQGDFRGGFASNVAQQNANERPLAAVMLSPALAAARPEWAAALDWNAAQVTAHYDLYNTARDILAVATNQPPPTTGTDERLQPFAHSLLHPLPPDRSCGLAGVPPTLCACTPWEALSAAESGATSMAAAESAFAAARSSRIPDVHPAAQLCVDSIAAATIDDTFLCARPKLHSVESIWKRGPYLRVMVRVSPRDFAGVRPVFHCMFEIGDTTDNTPKSALRDTADSAAPRLRHLQTLRATAYAADQHECDPAEQGLPAEMCICSRRVEGADAIPKRGSGSHETEAAKKKEEKKKPTNTERSDAASETKALTTALRDTWTEAQVDTGAMERTRSDGALATGPRGGEAKAKVKPAALLETQEAGEGEAEAGGVDVLASVLGHVRLDAAERARRDKAAKAAKAGGGAGVEGGGEDEDDSALGRLLGLGRLGLTAHMARASGAGRHPTAPLTDDADARRELERAALSAAADGGDGSGGGSSGREGEALEVTREEEEELAEAEQAASAATGPVAHAARTRAAAAAAADDKDAEEAEALAAAQRALRRVVPAATGGAGAGGGALAGSGLAAGATTKAGLARAAEALVDRAEASEALGDLGDAAEDVRELEAAVGKEKKHRGFSLLGWLARAIVH